MIMKSQTVKLVITQVIKVYFNSVFFELIKVKYLILCNFMAVDHGHDL